MIKFFAVLLVFTASCVSCAKNVNVIDAPPFNPNVMLFTPYGFGHGCPTKYGIVTARHLIQPDRRMPPVQSRWSDTYGNEGSAAVLMLSNEQDVAILSITDGDSPGISSIGTVEEGDIIRFWLYNFEDKEHAFTSYMRNAKVLKKLGGHIIFDNPPEPGASGSCIVNEKGLVVGIVIWGLAMRNEDRVGLGVIIPQE